MKVRQARAFTYFAGRKMDNLAATPQSIAEVADMKPFPRILPSIGWIVLYFLLQGVCTAVIMAVGIGVSGPGGTASALNNPMVILWGLVSSAIIQMALMWLYLRKDGRARLLGLTDFGRLSFSRVAALAIVFVVAAMLFNFLYAHYAIPGVKMQEEMEKMIASIPRTPLNIAAGLFAIGIAAPIVEELLFRGMLQNALGKYMPFWGAIILSSLAFALVHMQPYAIPGLMSLSLAFGFLYHLTGSLRTNILLHMANNIFALLITQGVS